MRAELTAQRSAYPRRRTAKASIAIHVARRFPASAERVFHAWLDPAIAGRWLFATATRPIASVEIHPRVAGSFRFVDQRHGGCVTYGGEYTDIVPHRRLGFILRSDADRHVATRVRVEIAPWKQGSALTLLHEGVPPEYASHTRARWIGMLYGLAATLELLALS